MFTIDEKPGVWVLYGYDVGPYAVSIHINPVEALAQGHNGYHTAWWPIDVEFRAAIDSWDDRKRDFPEEVKRLYSQAISALPRSD